MKFIIPWIAVASLVHQGLTQSSPCSLPSRQTNLTACLSAIGRKARDDSLFWFGTGYSQLCPGGPDFSPECSLPTNLSIPQSIASLLFSPGAFNANTLDRYLDVTYTSKSGAYHGCGNNFEFSDAATFTLDPVSSVAHESWTARDMPDIRWETNSGEYYTLVVIAVPHGRANGLYININENEIGNPQAVVQSYTGPINPAKRSDVLAFVLFAQGRRMLQLDPRWKGINWNLPFKVSDFMTAHGLNSPIAINWLLVIGDAYAAEQNMALLNNCPAYVTEAARQQKRPFIADDAVLTVLVNVTFSPPPLQFNSCCAYFSYPKKTTRANPIGNGLVKAGDVRTGYPPTVQLTIAKYMFQAAVDFADKQYTLVMVDPDVPSPSAGTNEKPLLHWLIINIRYGNITNGNELRTYRGPGPPDALPHYYYFLLYEQQFQLGLDSVDPHMPMGNPCDRCLFNISGFTSSNGLQLIGASWMVSQNDEFVRYSRIDRGRPEAEECQEIPGYADPCPIIISASTTKNSLCLCFVTVAVWLLLTRK